MFKFMPSDADGIPKKRKQVAKACEACRQRKRRCEHMASIQGDASSSIRQGGIRGFQESPIQPTEAEVSTDIASSSPNFRRRTERSDTRFVGDLNPQGMLLAATHSTTSKETPDIDNVGLWLALRSTREELAENEQDNFEDYETSYICTLDPELGRLLLPSLRSRCLATLPPAEDAKVLIDLYFDKINPLLPLVSQAELLNMDRSQPGAILLCQGIYLAAASSPKAVDYLRLSGPSSTLLTQSEFARKMAAAMRTSLDLGLGIDKFIVLQALILLSLYMKGPDEGDVSAQMAGRAVHHAHILGLHLGRREPTINSAQEDTLFCCVWVLDRLVGTFQGMPLLMHERDIGRDLHACFGQQTPLFRLILRIVEDLDRITAFYRPTHVHIPEIPAFDTSDFEDMVVQSGATRQDTSLLATAEVFFHVISILSCRWTSRDTSSRFASQVRMSFAASRITSIVSQEYFNRLSPIPIVPYAVSLSLTVAYREMRNSKLVMYQARARRQLEANCRILKELGNVFSSAAKMAEMGEQVLREMERVSSSLKSDSHPHPVERTKFLSGQEQTEQTDVSSATVPWDSRIPRVEETGNDITPLADPSFLDMSTFDVFGQFDPSFDLNAYDSALGGGFLDLLLPPNSEEYWQS